MTIHDYLQTLAEQADDLLEKDLEETENQVAFFSLRTQAEAAVAPVLGQDHHAIHELQHLLGIPTADTLVRILGILRGCLAAHAAGISSSGLVSWDLGNP